MGPQGPGNRCPCCNSKGVNPVVRFTLDLIDINATGKASTQLNLVPTRILANLFFYHPICSFYLSLRLGVIHSSIFVFESHHFFDFC